MSLLQETPFGLYCQPGNFYVDPWRPVDRAVVTHPHSDHATPGSKSYLAAREGEHIFRMRLGTEPAMDFLNYGEPITIGGVEVSLHPAGHMTGSAQVRVEYKGEIVVVSGDYKLQQDSTCRPFEPVRSHTFITESTFGLPIYAWEETEKVANEINTWWRSNQAHGQCSVLYGYTVGKAQRLLSIVDSSIGPILGHGAILSACRAYEKCGIELPELKSIHDLKPKQDCSPFLVVAPPSASGTTWLRRFGTVSTAMASGWMQVRGIRRRRSVDRGFVISDHVDWQDLLTAIEATGAENVWVTHGYTHQVVRTLEARGYNAKVIKTEFRGDDDTSESSEDSTNEEALVKGANTPSEIPNGSDEAGEGSRQ